jgi:DNA-binding response OmpR family regulator
MSAPPVVLVADDDADILWLVQHLLETAGFAVITASDGEEALRKAHESRPDMVLLDVMMPHLTGLEVLTQLRASPELEGTPVALLTARVADADAAAAADDYIPKPFSPADLVQRVAALAGHPLVPAPT